MEATGSKRFFIVDDNIVSRPGIARELCRELIPLKISWVGQASIHIAQDEELLDLMVRRGCLGVLIGMESLDQANLRDMGKSWNLAGGSYADSLRRFRATAWQSTALSSSATTTTTAPRFTAASTLPASNSSSWRRSTIWFLSPGRRSIAACSKRAGCSSRAVARPRIAASAMSLLARGSSNPRN